MALPVLLEALKAAFIVSEAAPDARNVLSAARRRPRMREKCFLRLGGGLESVESRIVVFPAVLKAADPELVPLPAAFRATKVLFSGSRSPARRWKLLSSAPGRPPRRLEHFYWLPVAQRPGGSFAGELSGCTSFRVRDSTAPLLLRQPFC